MNPGGDKPFDVEHKFSRTVSELSVVEQPTVAVVITTYNHARYLSEAIESVLSQTRPSDQIILVDDGSEDDPASVASAFPMVVFICQPNQGLSAARNTGLAAATSDFVVFLDADDRLLPAALEAGLACHRASENLAFVYGGHRLIAADGTSLGADRYAPLSSVPYLQLLQGNAIGMHATVMYRRVSLVKAGGFDVMLRRCEDYDVYLRLARSVRIGSHPITVAEYRKHGQNMSSNHGEMLKCTLRVQKRSASLSKGSVDAERASRRGRAIWREYYGGEMLRSAMRQSEGRPQALIQALWTSPSAVAMSLARGGIRRLRRWRHGSAPRLGRVRLGDLGKTSPIDRDFGYGRGTPVDRLYVEDFLSLHQADIAGCVLEVGDDSYSRRFGGARITKQDVLHIDGGNPAATIIGDISNFNVLPVESFDCIVLTQTLHLIYDLRKALGHLHAALKPGGVLLLTVPGVSSIDRGEWGATWYWSLTTAALGRLLQEYFHPTAIEIDFGGNVFAATAFLHGLAREELDRAKLLVRDPSYPVIVSACARKAKAA